MPEDEGFDIAEDGQPVFGALVKPLKNGGLMLVIFLKDDANGPAMCMQMNDEASIAVATRLEQEVGLGKE